jgi:hypothetical protein
VLAPEQWRDEPITGAADVFAWGCLITYAGTGHWPFPGDSEPELRRAILRSAPDLTGLDAAMLAAAQAALGKSPAARPTITALSGLLSARIDAGPSAQRGRTTRIGRRAVIGTAAAAAAAVCDNPRASRQARRGPVVVGVHQRGRDGRGRKAVLGHLVAQPDGRLGRARHRTCKEGGEVRGVRGLLRRSITAPAAVFASTSAHRVTAGRNNGCGNGCRTWSTAATGPYTRVRFMLEQAQIIGVVGFSADGSIVCLAQCVPGSSDMGERTCRSAVATWWVRPGGAREHQPGGDEERDQPGTEREGDRGRNGRQ